MGITEHSNKIKNVFTVGDRIKRNIFYSINILVYVLFLDNDCYLDKCYSTVFNFVILCLVWHAFSTKLQKRNSKVLWVFVTVFQAILSQVQKYNQVNSIYPEFCLSEICLVPSKTGQIRPTLLDNIQNKYSYIEYLL